MKRITSMAITFLVALLAVLLVTAGDGGAASKKAARKAAPQEASTNPCAPNAMQPCAANPCAAGQPGAAKPATAKMIKAEIIAADLTKNLLSVRHEGKELRLQVDPRTSVRQGPSTKSLADLQPGRKATISYVERDGQRNATYVYLAAAAAANPCGGNPCAAKNPCAAQSNPCAAKGKNPCAANPCAPQKK